jgi:hypothetical protein
MARKIQTDEISTISEFSSYLESVLDEDDVLFRGQQRDLPLIPKIGRLRLHDVLVETEQRMFADFQRQALPFIPDEPKSEWDWLALAQHHGMATRLLDWTGNPMAALWFAVSCPPHDGQRGVVWALTTSDDDYVNVNTTISPFAVRRTMVFRPRHITRRIVAQSGWFTVHKFFKDKGRFVDLAKNVRYKGRLRKVLVDPSAFASIRRELDRWGFNAANLYADLPGLCQHVEWQHSLLSDESE